MQGDIAIGVGGETFFVLDGDASQHQLTAFAKTMRVVTLSYS
jgi:hypothetical protein